METIIIMITAAIAKKIAIIVVMMIMLMRTGNRGGKHESQWNPIICTILLWFPKYDLSVTMQPVQYMPVLGIHDYVLHTYSWIEVIQSTTNIAVLFILMPPVNKLYCCLWYILSDTFWRSTCSETGSTFIYKMQCVVIKYTLSNHNPIKRP